MVWWKFFFLHSNVTMEKRYTWHDPDSNPDRSRGKPTLYQLRHGARNWNLNLCTFIYFWRLIASRNVDKRPGWNHETAIGWRSKIGRSRKTWKSSPIARYIPLLANKIIIILPWFFTMYVIVFFYDTKMSWIWLIIY